MFEGYAYVVCFSHVNASFKIKVGLESLIGNYPKNSSLRMLLIKQFVAWFTRFL